MKLYALLLTFILTCQGAKPPSCDDAVPFSSFFTGQCMNKWKKLKPMLRPTQPAVGWAWVQRKLDKDFSSKSDAQDEMDDLPIPTVLGPGNLLYAVDSHHTMTALDLSGYDDTKVIVDVLCDLRALSIEEFWQEMQERNWVYLISAPESRSSLPTPISPDDLPQEFSSELMANDYYRSLSAFVRKVQNHTCDSSDEYCQRCYDRVCSEDGGGIPFFEFRWGYFFNDATFGASGGWASEEDRKVRVTGGGVREEGSEEWSEERTSLLPTRNRSNVAKNISAS